jgi:predicted permease
MALDINVVTNTVATMFLLLCVGYAARKLKFFDAELQKKLSDIIICIAQPFLIIYSVLSIDYSNEKLKQGFFIMAIGIGVHALTAAIAYIAAIRHKNNNERAITEFGILFANCGFLGIPVLKALFGDVGGFWASFYIIIFNLVQWTYGMLILGRGRDNIKMNLKNVMVNYGTIPCLIGITLFLLRIRLPSPVMNASNYIGSLCTPVSMLVIGGTIATIPFKKLFSNVKIYYLCAVKLFAVPFIVILVCKLIGLSSDMIMFAAVMSSLPTAANVAMFGEHYNIVPDFASHASGLATLLSAVTVPIMMKFAEFIIGL